jgi:hypothetical protein
MSGSNRLRSGAERMRQFMQPPFPLRVRDAPYDCWEIRNGQLEICGYIRGRHGRYEFCLRDWRNAEWTRTTQRFRDLAAALVRWSDASDNGKAQDDI